VRTAGKVLLAAIKLRLFAILPLRPLCTKLFAPLLQALFTALSALPFLKLFHPLLTKLFALPFLKLFQPLLTKLFALLFLALLAELLLLSSSVLP
jgi:hypothetical protein